MNACNVCSVCRSARIRGAGTLDGYSLSRCDDCSHVFVSAGLGDGELANAYTSDYYRKGQQAESSGYEDYLRDAPARTRGFEERLSQIEANVVGRGRLLDYGCAVGLFVKVANDAGWEAIGYERSEWAVQYGREVLGLDIICGTGDDAPPFEGRFDVITMWDVLEHLEHPRAVLESVSAWLKPGGMLALNTINRSSAGARLAGKHWRHLAPPHHLQYFSRASLKRLLRDCGFELRAMQNRGVIMTADRRRPTPRGVVAVAESIGTHWRATTVATLLNLRDEIEIMAVRRC